jgi:hypothetical protein
MECGKPGHIKCTKEKESDKIPIDTVMKEDLDEFVTRLGSSKGPATFMEEDSDNDNVRFSFDYIEEFKVPESVKKN